MNELSGSGSEPGSGIDAGLLAARSRRGVAGIVAAPSASMTSSARP